MRLQRVLGLLLKQGAAVKQLKFRSAAFYFLSPPVPVVSAHAGGLPRSVSENEPLLQGAVRPEMGVGRTETRC